MFVYNISGSTDKLWQQKSELCRLSIVAQLHLSIMNINVENLHKILIHFAYAWVEYDCGKFTAQKVMMKFNYILFSLHANTAQARLHASTLGICILIWWAICGTFISWNKEHSTRMVFQQHLAVFLDNFANFMNSIHKWRIRWMNLHRRKMEISLKLRLNGLKEVIFFSWTEFFQNLMFTKGSMSTESMNISRITFCLILIATVFSRFPFLICK